MTKTAYFNHLSDESRHLLVRHFLREATTGEQSDLNP